MFVSPWEHPVYPPSLTVFKNHLISLCSQNSVECLQISCGTPDDHAGPFLKYPMLLGLNMIFGWPKNHLMSAQAFVSPWKHLSTSPTQTNIQNSLEFPTLSTQIYRNSGCTLSFVVQICWNSCCTLSFIAQICRNSGCTLSVVVQICQNSHCMLSFVVQICRNSRCTHSFVVQICRYSGHTLSFLVQVSRNSGHTLYRFAGTPTALSHLLYRFAGTLATLCPDLLELQPHSLICCTESL